MPQDPPLPKIYQQLIHPTPLVPVQLAPNQPTIWCKLDYQNPSGSTKDRIAAYIIGLAHESGLLPPDRLIVEASSGSTSIAMAMVCARLNLRFAAVMPHGVSSERIKMIKAYGAQVIQTPAKEGVKGAMLHAIKLGQEQDAFLPRQFENTQNAHAHQYGTARELLAQLAQHNIPTLHAFASGIGTGGTLVGVVDGLSKLFLPHQMPTLIQIQVNDEEAIQTTRQLIQRGFPAGPSSGLNFAAARKAAQQLGPHAQVATIFPDRMERYFSTELFEGL